MPLPLPKPSATEPKAIGIFIEHGYPTMAFVLALSWRWRAPVTTLLLALVALFRVW